MIESLTDPKHIARLMVAGVPVVSIPESAERFPTFLAWWMEIGRLNPNNHGGWSTLSGPWVTHGRIELIDLDGWGALLPEDRERIKAWADSLPIGIFCD
ncbi:MAG: hypothetical protein ABSE46_13560 [Terracidiphilus sp.]